MAVPSKLSCFTALLLFFLVSPSIQASFRPKALVLPVYKDSSTLQYVTQIKQRTPLVPVNLTLDLGGEYMWVDCYDGYKSSTYKGVPCNSAQCSLAKPRLSCGSCNPLPNPDCKYSTCNLQPVNTITGIATTGEFGQDVLSIQSTDGKSSGNFVSVPKFLFTCGFVLDRLASGVKGMAGLGRTKISISTQLPAAFSFRRKFAMCLSSGKGVVFFGDGPYTFLGRFTSDISKSLVHTPLILNPVSTSPLHTEGEASTDYFIGVKGISIQGKSVPLKKSLLSINKQGIGGTKISTIDPYTVMETSIYVAVVNAFVKELSAIPRVPAVAPFTTCYNAKRFSSTRVGPGVPQIDIELQKNQNWTIFGANSMVQVNKDVLCLAFVDGGKKPRTSIVIGGHQIEDNLLQFDLAASRLGFSSTLLFRQTNCANFNLTSHA